jgi:cation:H+ antiporter
MEGLSTSVVIGIAVIALTATLGATEVLVRGVGRLARNLGLLGGIIGLIVALGADSPEISSSVAAVASGSAAAGVGVVFGSNVFNIAALFGAATFAAGELRIHTSALVLDGGVAIAATLAIGASILGVVSVAVGWLLLLIVFVPYVIFLSLRPVTVARLRVPSAIRRFLMRCSREAGVEGDEICDSVAERGGGAAPVRSWRPVLLMLPAVMIIVIGSTLLVQSALTLGRRWEVSSVIVGVVALAAATSLPNAYAAMRLAMEGHGAAVVSATFNSNTLNLFAGFAIPVLFVPSLRDAVPRAYLCWLLGMSVLALILLARGLRRPGALVLLIGYASFVAYAVLTA